MSRRTNPGRGRNAGGGQNAVIEELRELPAKPSTLSPSTFRNEGTLQATTAGERSKTADIDAAGVIGVRGNERFGLSLPAYEQFTTDGTAGNTETFALSNSLADTPNTENLVLWEGSTYVQPDAVDPAADTFDYTDDGTGSTLHAYFISDEAADIEILKVTESGGATQALYEESLRLVHQTNQSEQPETPDVDQTPLNGIVPRDYSIEVYVDAPYTVRWEDPAGDGTEPTNAMFSFPINRGKGSVAGLQDVIAHDMAQE